MKDDQIVCPRCGEDCGYYYVAVVRHHQSYTFKGVGIDCVMDQISGGKECRCCGCGKIITKFVESLET